MGRADYLKLDDWNALCDRCQRKYKASQLKLEWTGWYVCKTCWEPRHKQDFLKGKPDNSNVPWTRPDSNANTSVTLVDGSTLSSDNLRDLVGDADKTLRVDGTPRMNGVQDWSTTFTTNRQATFNSTDAQFGDTFNIYYTATETAFTFSIVGETTRATTINYLGVWRYSGSVWQEQSYTPLGL